MSNTMLAGWASSSGICNEALSMSTSESVSDPKPPHAATRTAANKIDDRNHALIF